MRCGPYDLLRRVDTGGMGEVFLADGPLPGGIRGRLAIKRVLPELAGDQTFVTMFLDEARVVRLFDHPNVCRVYEMGVCEGLPFLAMEWLEGAPLRRLLRANPKGLHVEVVLALGVELARALAYVHELRDEEGRALGVVHRDVCPANIFVTRAGRAKLLDFGLARARTHVHRTRSGVVKGKFGYLAPERLQGRDEPRSDVFGLGLCLYEALVGRRLFEGAHPAAVMAAVQTYRAPPRIREHRPDVPDSLEAILGRALAPQPADRFESAEALGRALESMLAGGAEGALSERLARIVPQDPVDPAGPDGATHGGATDAAAEEIDDVTRHWRRDAQRRARLLRLLPALAAAAVALLALGTCQL